MLLECVWLTDKRTTRAKIAEKMGNWQEKPRDLVWRACSGNSTARKHRDNFIVPNSVRRLQTILKFTYYLIYRSSQSPRFTKNIKIIAWSGSTIMFGFRKKNGTNHFYGQKDVSYRCSRWIYIVLERFPKIPALQHASASRLRNRNGLGCFISTRT